MSPGFDLSSLQLLITHLQWNLLLLFQQLLLLWLLAAAFLAACALLFEVLDANKHGDTAVIEIIAGHIDADEDDDNDDKSNQDSQSNFKGVSGS